MGHAHRRAVPIAFCTETEHPALHRLAVAQLGVWPEHEKFLTKRFALGDQGVADRLAALVLKLAGDDLATLCADYRWTCERILEEELHFRRTGKYRRSSFAEAEREVYANREYMTRYVNGLLLSQVWWSNHTSVVACFAGDFLPRNRPGYAHLEIGPGHGLMLHLAASDPACAVAAGWDVSEASVAATARALRSLGTPRDVVLERRSVFDPPDAGTRFDSVVISEVCEHLEDPQGALASLRPFLTREGRLFVNMPINSPAPDHIFLLRTPEEVVELVRASGYEVESSRFFPLAGYTEERARKAGLTISCVVVGRPAS